MSARGALGSARDARVKSRDSTRFRAPEDISPPGHELRVSWPGAAGATDVDVTDALLVLSSAEVAHDQADLPLGATSDTVDVTIPAHERVRSLTLQELRFDDATDLLDANGLSAKGVRLTVSLHDGRAFQPPQFAVPSVSGGQMMPAVLAGAAFSEGVLRLNDVTATKVRLNLVQGDTPTEFTRQAVSLKRASGVTVLPSRNVNVAGPDGKSVFSVPDELPVIAGGHEVDLRHALKQAFTAALKGRQPLEANFRVTGDAGCAAYVSLGAVHGALLRTHSGVLSTEVSGAPAPLVLDGALGNAAPDVATGDLSVKYLGLRILAPFSDAVPAFGGTRGAVVRETPVLRALPPAALAGPPLARVGLIGRAPEACELSLQVVQFQGGVAGAPLGPPATLKLAADAAEDEAGLARVACWWIELADLPAPEGPVALALRATSGRFLWAAAPAATAPGVAPDQPLVRLAVRDPDPGGRPLTLGGTTLLAVSAETAHLPAFAFPAARFAGAPPLLDSELFLTVDVSDLTLRYAR